MLNELDCDIVVNEIEFQSRYYVNFQRDTLGEVMHPLPAQIWGGGCHRGVMVKAMDCGIVEREFVLQSRYYVHLRANTLGKGMNPLILPAMG